ncbi:hypothetical protein G7Y31_08565 [Corynebacterium lizhenjunii]|uniref:Uncharacterized protein n=1 Tax=Corynebacterium lizhenjunii TaxID=2709394 RepID=A0A7T0PAQ5_9CORY|nr:hypothetical protein [Corynebacterium lizhenjunii]QPK78600.1 hypothetical protein G7Y31_08565 [Corynebacterium lizhenjunii]
MTRVLITEPVRTRQDLYRALGAVHCCGECVAPSNLDGLADFLREHRIRTIIAADLAMELADYATLKRVLDDVGVALLR